MVRNRRLASAVSDQGFVTAVRMLGYKEVGSALNGKRRKFLALLRDKAVSVIVVEHRDRFARFGAEYVEAALAASGRQLLVVDPAEVDEDRPCAPGCTGSGPPRTGHAGR